MGVSRQLASEFSKYAAKRRRPIVTYLAAERSMPPFFRARLRYLRNRIDDCRLLREMDVVRAWHWRDSFATSKKSCRRSLLGRLPFWCAGITEARSGPCQILWNNEKVFPVF
jgi:hypothetical protein